MASSTRRSFSSSQGRPSGHRRLSAERHVATLPRRLAKSTCADKKRRSLKREGVFSGCLCCILHLTRRCANFCCNVGPKPRCVDVAARRPLAASIPQRGACHGVHGRGSPSISVSPAAGAATKISPADASTRTALYQPGHRRARGSG